MDKPALDLQGAEIRSDDDVPDNVRLLSNTLNERGIGNRDDDGGRIESLRRKQDGAAPL